MKTASAKNKGRRLQQHVVERILHYHPTLDGRDVRSLPMGTPGEDILLSSAAICCFPFSVEAKNQEKLNIWDALEQADGTNRELIPLVVFKRNRSDVYCALKLDDLLGVMCETKGQSQAQVLGSPANSRQLQCDAGRVD